MTEPVVFFTDHYIHYKTMSFLFILIPIFNIIILMVKEEKGEYV